MLDERAFFNEKPEQRPAKYACPRCRRVNEYTVRWVRRVRKSQPPPGAGDQDRARFAKLRDHLLRLDEELVCRTCGKKFEIPSQHSLLFLDQLEGLPKDVEEDAASRQSDGAAPAGGGDQPAIDRSKLPARFTRPTRGWRG
jgi:DNA-directed RNA polymerase subunit RPC12/RpoP